MLKTLHDLKVNEAGQVSHLRFDNGVKLQMLLAMGILPGVEVKIVQRFPSVLFQVGFAEFAIDSEMAKCVFISL